ncbi:MAG TPA: diguanylate cyclase [Pseudomonas sp.]|nr:diguanylate cyclase [Pseudomonas sp.]
MPDSGPEISDFITELDAAIEAHMDWTHRILRCAVLRTTPGEDVLAPAAHCLCRFGRWFSANLKQFEKLDKANARHLQVVHQAMHDATRVICTDLLAGQPGQERDLLIFGKSQSELVHLLTGFKTHFVADLMQHDPLTGLPLRHGIEAQFLDIQKNCRRTHNLLYLVMIDVDHFKRVNDRYGHPVGDLALRHLADTLKRNLRPSEPLYRFGGEEFLLLLQCRSPEAAAAAARRLLYAVRHTPVPLQSEEPLLLTVTLGLAQVADDETLTCAVERADRALYAGKKAGRDRFEVALD